MTSSPTTVSTDPIDVSAIVIGLDHLARAEVQSAMRAIAEKGDTSTKAGLVRMLRAAVDVLESAEASWMYGHAEGGPPVAVADAKARFTEVAHRARSRFPVEVIRNAHGTIARQPSAPEVASEEPGVVLVTVVVAARRELADVVDPSTRAGLREGLETLRGIDEAALVALEVIWSPADEADRVSPTDLEARHPEIRKIAS